MNHENKLYKAKRTGFKCGYIKGDKSVTLLISETDTPLRKIHLTITAECENVNLDSLARAIELNRHAMERLSTYDGESVLKAIGPFWNDLGNGDDAITLTMYSNAVTKSNKLLGV